MARCRVIPRSATHPAKGSPPDRRFGVTTSSSLHDVSGKGASQALVSALPPSLSLGSFPARLDFEVLLDPESVATTDGLPPRSRSFLPWASLSPPRSTRHRSLRSSEEEKDALGKGEGLTTTTVRTRKLRRLKSPRRFPNSPRKARCVGVYPALGSLGPSLTQAASRRNRTVVSSAGVRVDLLEVLHVKEHVPGPSRERG